MTEVASDSLLDQRGFIQQECSTQAHQLLLSRLRKWSGRTRDTATISATATGVTTGATTGATKWPDTKTTNHHVHLFSTNHSYQRSMISCQSKVNMSDTLNKIS